MIYGSYLRDDEDIIGSAWKVALFDTLAASARSTCHHPAMATAGSRSDQGAGLMFIYRPALFQSMPGSRLLVIVFFAAYCWRA